MDTMSAVSSVIQLLSDLLPSGTIQFEAGDHVQVEGLKGLADSLQSFATVVSFVPCILLYRF